ncbi:MAG: hypothetical protein FJ147_24320 [Deltaproteobacteria bacterium]|nr:hypothetical protein [Deltaproteobacteria bacterium]
MLFLLGRKADRALELIRREFAKAGTDIVVRDFLRVSYAALFPNKGNEHVGNVICRRRQYTHRIKDECDVTPLVPSCSVSERAAVRIMESDCHELIRGHGWRWTRPSLSVTPR